MKSIKPGRGPSMMGGITGIFVAIFGVIWTFIAFRIMPVMALFGVCFVAIAVVNVIYNFKNATGKSRYSAFDITDGSEEGDPLNERFGEREGVFSGSFCPYCGERVKAEHEFCSSCGKRLD